jgi:putative hydrolase of the HAD superfamily
MMPEYQAVIFDLGSTLINYENSSWDELGRLGCANACPILENLASVEVTPDKLWEDFHQAIDQMFINHREDLAEIDLLMVTNSILSKLGITSLDGLSPKFIDAYYQPITNQITLLPGAAGLLRKLKEAGLTTGLVSNTIFPAEYHREEMKRFGIFEYFDFTIFSSEFKFRKPRKEIYLRALELAAANPEQAVFVGDRLMEDVAGPQSVGIRGILKQVDGRDYSAPIVPFRTIRMLNELERIILS